MKTAVGLLSLVACVASCTALAVVVRHVRAHRQEFWQRAEQYVVKAPDGVERAVLLASHDSVGLLTKTQQGKAAVVLQINALDGTPQVTVGFTDRTSGQYTYATVGVDRLVRLLESAARGVPPERSR